MLKGKVAVVTGMGSGVSIAVAKKCLDNGAKVVLLGVKPEILESSISRLKGYSASYEVYSLPVDNSADGVYKAFEKIKAKFGSVDVLINNGCVTDRENIYEFNQEDFAKNIHASLSASFVYSQGAARIMRTQHKGAIVNCGSMVNIFGRSGGVSFPTTKYDIGGITKSLAREMGRDGIRVNAVTSGVLQMEMDAELPEEMVKPLTATIPMGRMGTPDDIANACIFLASDLAGYISAVVIPVDGASMM